MKIHKDWIKISTALLLLVGVISGFLFLDVRHDLEGLFTWIQEQGNWGYLSIALCYLIFPVFLIPISPLTLISGMVYPFFSAVLLVAVASNLSAVMTFLMGRFLLRDWVAKKIKSSRKLTVLDHAIGQEGWKIIAMMRFVPIFPFAPINCFFGATRVSVWHYALASFLGMLPGTIAYVYLGTLTGNLTDLLSGESEWNSLQWMLSGLGFAVLIFLLFYLVRFSKKTLAHYDKSLTDLT